VFKILKGRKTYIVSGLMVAISVVRMIVGEMSIAEFVMSPDVMALLNGIGLGTLRSGIASR